MDEILLEYGGVAYYIDFDGLTELVKYEDDEPKDKTVDTEERVININGGTERVESITKTQPKGREIDISRYETCRTLLEILLSSVEPSDDSLGVERGLKDEPLSFKIAFNTLVKYGVLKEL